MHGLNFFAHGDGFKSIAQDYQQGIHLNRFDHIFIGTVFHG